MPLDQPLTALTDYALALASLGFAIAIARHIGPYTRVSGWLWSAALAAASRRRRGPRAPRRGGRTRPIT